MEDGILGKQLIDILLEEQCSCVIRKGSAVRMFRERGVKDLYRLLREEPEFLNGASVADKVVGKGAAALMILGGVHELFAGVVSQAALQLLQVTNIRVGYSVVVPHIINRANTDWCPLEKRCADAKSAEECLPVIEHFIKLD